MPYRISYLKLRLLIQPQSNRMKNLNQTEIAYQLSNLRIFVVVKQKR